MNRFKNILYLPGNQVDAQSLSLKRVISLAKNNQADLTLLKVLPRLSLSSGLKDLGISRQELDTKVCEHEDASLRELLASLTPDLEARGILKKGKKYVETIRAVQENNFDLVVKEVDEAEWTDRFIGSDDLLLLRMCPCPVWLMKKNEKENYSRVMAAVDFDRDGESDNAELNSMILGLASSVSLSDFAALHVANVYDVPEAGFMSLWVEQPDKVQSRLFALEYKERQAQMKALLDSLKQKYGEETSKFLSPNAHIVQGMASRELPRIAERISADLVVMGTLGRVGIAGIVIGNTAESVLSQLHCSILAVKPEGFISPINLKTDKK